MVGRSGISVLRFGSESLVSPRQRFESGTLHRRGPCPGMHMHGSAIHDHMKHTSNADQKVHSDAAVPVNGQQKAADTRCCGLVSISAMPASEIAIAVPPALASVCETESYRDAADNAPPRHYRPPIS